MEQRFGICNLSVVPLREGPSDKTEQLSQLLFGDHFELLRLEEKWVYIRTAYDQYEGWIDHQQYREIDRATYLQMDDCHTVVPCEITNPIKKADQSLLYLTPGSNLPMFNEGYCYIGDEKYEVKGKFKINAAAAFRAEVRATAMFYLNTPYLWGGKTPFGIDCSGFTQMVYKILGIQLKRDAWQQAEEGQVVDFLQEAELGDLAFFDNAEGRITHVGIMLSNSQIIHASGRVKIDAIDGEGIFSTDLKKYTHKLRIIKRYAS